MTLTDAACERARRLASLRLDGVCTEFEEARLTSHLAGCPACRAFTDAVADATAAIRATPPITGPSLAIRTRPRRSVSTRALQSAAAAIIVATAGLSGLAGLSEQQRESLESSSSPQRPAYLDSANYEQRIIAAVTHVPRHGRRIAT